MRLSVSRTGKETVGMKEEMPIYTIMMEPSITVTVEARSQQAAMDEAEQMIYDLEDYGGVTIQRMSSDVCDGEEEEA